MGLTNTKYYPAFKVKITCISVLHVEIKTRNNVKFIYIYTTTTQKKYLNCPNSRYFRLNPSAPRQVEKLEKFDDTKVVVRSRKSKG
jgi:hypothetical protein